MLRLETATVFVLYFFPIVYVRVLMKAKRANCNCTEFSVFLCSFDLSKRQKTCPPSCPPLCIHQLFQSEQWPHWKSSKKPAVQVRGKTT